MKYIDADKLIAEIERLYYNESEKDESILAADAYKNALDAVEKVIASLQQEQPSLPSDIDEAAKQIVIQKHPCMEDCLILGDRLTRGELIALVKAGIEWMAGQGVSVDGKVVMDFSEPYDIINRRLIAKLGDALLKVEPGEVIVQIRKKQ